MSDRIDLWIFHPVIRDPNKDEPDLSFYMDEGKYRIILMSCDVLGIQDEDIYFSEKEFYSESVRSARPRLKGTIGNVGGISSSKIRYSASMITSNRGTDEGMKPGLILKSRYATIDDKKGDQYLSDMLDVLHREKIKTWKAMK